MTSWKQLLGGIVLLVITLGSGWVAPASVWAAPITETSATETQAQQPPEITFLQVLPVNPHQVLVVGMGDSETTALAKPTVERVSIDTLALTFHHVKLSKNLQNYLSSEAASVMMQPFEGTVAVKETPQYTRVLFTSDTLEHLYWFNSVGEFSDAALTELSAYKPMTAWDKSRPAECAKTHPWIQKAYDAFQKDENNRAAAYINLLYRSGQCGGVAFYQLAVAQNLGNDDWLNALLIYRDGAQRYPRHMGLPYAALLSELQSYDKASVVLNDLNSHRTELTANQQMHLDYMLGTQLAQSQSQHAFKQAWIHLQNAAVLSGGNPAVLYNMAVVADRSQDAQTAKALYQDVLPSLTQEEQTAVRKRLDMLNQLKPNPAQLLVQ